MFRLAIGDKFYVYYFDKEERNCVADRLGGWTLS